MSNWQAAEEGDIQDDFEFDLEATVSKNNQRLILNVFVRIKMKRIQLSF